MRTRWAAPSRPLRKAIRPILVGPKDKIAAVAREHRIPGSEIVETAHSHDAAAKGVALIRAVGHRVVPTAALNAADRERGRCRPMPHVAIELRAAE